MGGGLMQLVAYGAQDIYLTGQPQITFFKSVYRRYTNFALESILQTINGTVKGGSRVSVTISRNGDLLSDIQFRVPSSIVYVPEAEYGDINQGSGSYERLKLIQYAELEIGGQLISRIYGDWMQIWSELSIRRSPTNADPLASCLTLNHPEVVGDNEIFIPLQFWFHQRPGLAIPLIALQYHEVKINFEFNQNYRDTKQSQSKFTPKYQGVEVWADYVYLDTTERRQFAQNAHEYLIEQLQFQENQVKPGVNTILLNLNHPVKYLSWAIKNTADPDLPNGFLPYQSAKIVLNGTDRFQERTRKYFSTYQVYKHWPTNAYFPDYTFYFDNTSVTPSVYSFGISPAEHQPSGTCNFSRIDTAQLILNGVQNQAPIHIYATNYNVLRIMSGMGGLAYSN
jgi:hypothetical protein